MYRCYGCDGPAQVKCDCLDEPTANVGEENPKPQPKDYNSNPDPWGWIDDVNKVNIGTGDAAC